MLIDKVELIHEFKILVPLTPERGVVLRKHESTVDSLGAIQIKGNSGVVTGILCGSGVDSYGLDSIRWPKDDYRQVLIKGIAGISVTEPVKLGDLVYIDEYGKFYTTVGDGRVEVRNARWLSTGFNPFMYIDGTDTIFVPKPNFEMSLEDNLDYVLRDFYESFGFPVPDFELPLISNLKATTPKPNLHVPLKEDFRFTKR